MVTFEKWLIKTLENNCGFLKIRRNETTYSIPYDKGEVGFFDERSNTITLRNLLTNSFDVISMPEVFNVEIFSMGNYSESLRMSLDLIESKLSPILLEEFSKLSRQDVLNLIFIDGMNINYMRVMDFMGYNLPVEFNRVNFDRFKTAGSISEKELCRIYDDYCSVVTKKMEMVIEDLTRNLGDDAKAIVSDIRDNVDKFLKSVRDIPPDKLQSRWPSLINPSPYYLQPRVALSDG